LFCPRISSRFWRWIFFFVTTHHPGCSLTWKSVCWVDQH
jgi:hypothetical protein